MLKPDPTCIRCAGRGYWHDVSIGTDRPCNCMYAHREEDTAPRYVKRIRYGETQWLVRLVYGSSIEWAGFRAVRTHFTKREAFAAKLLFPGSVVVRGKSK